MNFDDILIMSSYVLLVRCVAGGTTGAVDGWVPHSEQLDFATTIGSKRINGRDLPVSGWMKNRLKRN